jgi:hypothetical protein
MATGNAFAISIFCEGNIHTANPAGTKRLQVWGVAKCGHKFFAVDAPYELQYGFTVLYFMGFIINKGHFFIRFLFRGDMAAAGSSA